MIPPELITKAYNMGLYIVIGKARVTLRFRPRNNYGNRPSGVAMRRPILPGKSEYELLEEMLKEWNDYLDSGYSMTGGVYCD